MPAGKGSAHALGDRDGAEEALLVRPRSRRIAGPDAALAALVISIVALMILPLPTWLLDLLITSNLALSVTVLLVTLYVSDALKIATFPTLLLITTLIRLALNVSSTRLILLQADAGEMIHAFGSFVVRGNYVVGGVIFLILSIIQFVVIAKGSERVAEVGARFTLDAMPGKQMAIDAELRSGTIDGNEARLRRRQLSRESQFYGAMDGAMKFVKGDVIASFIIAIINILGGLLIGIFQRGMGAEEALKKYGLLTIGDGLVSQIPALLLSTAAGILVTRVASEDTEAALGKELSSQLLRSPKALAVAGGFVAFLGLVPGMPAIPLLLIGGLLFLVSRVADKKRAEPDDVTLAQPIQPGERGSGARRFVPVVVPWSLELSADLGPLLEDDERGDKLLRPGLRSAANAIRELLFRQLGVPLPACIIQVNARLPVRHVVLSIHEVPYHVLAPEAEVRDDQLAQYTVEKLLPILRARAADFLGISETQTLLDRLEQVAPATVRQVTPKPVGLGLLTDVLRRLVEERVSVRDLKGILEALSQVANADKDPLNLTEYVRSQLRRSLTYRVTEGRAALDVVLLSSDIEEAIRGAISRTAAGSFLTLNPASAREVASAIQRALLEARTKSGNAKVVVLTHSDIRRFVRKLIEADSPDQEVMAFTELLPELRLHSAATATVRG
jgi:type III secretion protein V